MAQTTETMTVKPQSDDTALSDIKAKKSKPVIVASGSKQVKVKVKKDKCIFEEDGAFVAGDEFFTTTERAAQLAGDVDVVEDKKSEDKK